MSLQSVVVTGVVVAAVAGAAISGALAHGTGGSQASAAAAEMLPSGASEGHWTTLEWAMVLTVVLAVVILACILVSLFVYRGRQTEGSALWLHLLALGVLPLSLMAFGNFATMEYAKE